MEIWNDTSSEAPTNYAPIYETIWIGVILIIIILSLILNSIVIAALLKSNFLRAKIHAVWILNLSIADWICSALVMPITLLSIFTHGQLLEKHKIFCVINGFTSVATLATSTYALMFVSIDRYLAVVHPLKYREYMTTTKAKRLAAFTWVFGIFLALPPSLEWPGFSYDEENYHCSPAWKKTCGYYILVVTTGLAFPILVILVAYFLIYRELKKQGIRFGRGRRFSVAIVPSMITRVETTCTNGTGPTNKAPNLNRSNKRTAWNERKIAFSGAILACAFFLFWIPYAVVNSCFTKNIVFPKSFKTFSMFLAYFNSVANPIIYSWTNVEIRRQIKALISRRCG